MYLLSQSLIYEKKGNYSEKHFEMAAKGGRGYFGVL